MHEAGANLPCQEKCRLCQLQAAARSAWDRLKPVPRCQPIKVAIGLAIPSIEAWYLCGVSADVSEAAWREGQRKRAYPYLVPDLKRRVYGTDRPFLRLETDRAVDAARRVIADLTGLAERFPIGFGSLAAEVRSW